MELYGFMAHDETVHQIPSMRNIVAQIAQQTLECARFIKDYSETRNYCESSTSKCSSYIINELRRLWAERTSEKMHPSTSVLFLSILGCALTSNRLRYAPR